MKLNALNTTESNCNIPISNFNIQMSPIAFDILSNKLYSNPILAVIRELLTNAYDSQIVNGNPDTPIDLHIPIMYDSYLKIRDYGIGLSSENIEQLYITFFNSTKNEDNNLTGCFGLGSKTPFAVSNSFTITSYHKGKKYVYSAIKNNGCPSIIKISEENTSEPTGLEINIPIDSNKYAPNLFFNEAMNYLKYIPEIKVNSNLDLASINGEKLFTIDNVAVYTSRYGGLYVKQGQNIYSLSEYRNTIEKEENFSFRYLYGNLDIVIEVPIGTFEITPNREQLSISQKNKFNVIKIVNDAQKSLSEFFVRDNFNKIVKHNYLLEIYKEKINHLYFENTLQKAPHGYTIKLFNVTYLNNYHMLVDVRYSSSYYFPFVFYDKSKNNVPITETTTFKFNHHNKNLIVFGFTRNLRGIAYKVRKLILYTDKYKDMNVYFIPLYSYYTKGNGSYAVEKRKNYVKFLKHLKKLFEICNNMKELTLDIEVTSMHNLLKEYNELGIIHTKKKEIIPIKEQAIQTSIYKVISVLPTREDSKLHIIRYEKSILNLQEILNTYQPFNTLLLKPIFYNIYNNNVFEDLLHIHDKNYKFFVREHITQNYEIDLNQNFFFLEVGKSRFKLLSKYYKVFDTTKFIEWVDSQNWFLGTKYSNVIPYEPYIKQLFKTIYTPKQQELIFNSKTYKKFELASQFCKRNNGYMYGIIDCYINMNNISTIFPKHVDVTYIKKHCNKFNDLLRLLNFLTETINCTRYYTYFNGNPSYKSPNIKYKSYRFNKYNIFEIIGGKYVLLQE